VVLRARDSPFEIETKNQVKNPESGGVGQASALLTFASANRSV
jgi:hypothetical protein